MSQPRFSAQRDANEAGIIAALQKAGAGVKKLNDPKASGTPDLLVGFRGVNFLLEVKGSKGNFSQEQRWFRDWWPGRKPVVVRTPREALVAIGAVSAIVGKDCRG